VYRVSGEFDHELMDSLDDRRVQWRELHSLAYERNPPLPRYAGPPKTVFILQDTEKAEHFYNTHLMPAGAQQQDAGERTGYKGEYEVPDAERASYDLKSLRFYRCGLACFSSVLLTAPHAENDSTRGTSCVE
jgi:hypothetical protein